MRKTLAIAMGLAVLFATSAMAGDYHYRTTLNCPDCHVMHSSQAHGYNADSAGTGFFVTPQGPNEYLLRNQIVPLCLSCHDNQTFAPDVFGANGGTQFANGRQAGALNRDNTAPYFDVTGHTLGSTAVAPGGTWKDSTDGLNCTDCHTVHGNAYYRNTRSRGVASAQRHLITYATGTNDLTLDVFQGSAGLANHYSANNIFFNEPNADSSKYAGFCKDCHTLFHGGTGSANMYNLADSAWVRHPTSVANISVSSATSRFKNRPYRVKVMSPTGTWGTDGSAWPTAPADLTPSCFSCHKGHGNQNAFGLIFATGDAPLGEQGDGAAPRQMCQQCHGQGTS
jgi:hypothetical protein